MTHSSHSRTNASIAFGRFRLFPHRRQLIAGDEVVPLGSRAFDILLALIEAEGEAVSFAALRKRVWGPGVAVDDHNVAVHISAIRKTLGEEGKFIVNERARGYRFSPPPIDPAPHGPASGVATNIPAPLSPLIGRESELSALSQLMRTHRLVTLTGLGGIGKTRLAIELARLALPLFPGGAWVAELVSVADGDVIETVIASALGLSIGPNRTLAETLKSLSTAPVLLVI